jgi:hypothetical protein
LDPKTQKWLVTGLAALLTSVLGRLLADALAKETPPPDQRSLRDDTKEAVFHAVVSVIAVILASVIVRQVFGRR